MHSDWVSNVRSFFEAMPIDDERKADTAIGMVGADALPMVHVVEVICESLAGCGFYKCAPDVQFMVEHDEKKAAFVESQISIRSVFQDALCLREGWGMCYTPGDSAKRETIVPSVQLLFGLIALDAEEAGEATTRNKPKAKANAKTAPKAAASAKASAKASSRQTVVVPKFNAADIFGYVYKARPQLTILQYQGAVTDDMRPIIDTFAGWAVAFGLSYRAEVMSPLAYGGFSESPCLMFALIPKPLVTFPDWTSMIKNMRAPIDDCFAPKSILYSDDDVDAIRGENDVSVKKSKGGEGWELEHVAAFEAQKMAWPPKLDIMGVDFNCLTARQAEVLFYAHTLWKPGWDWDFIDLGVNIDKIEAMLKDGAVVTSPWSNRVIPPVTSKSSIVARVASPDLVARKVTGCELFAVLGMGKKMWKNGEVPQRTYDDALLYAFVSTSMPAFVSIPFVLGCMGANVVDVAECVADGSPGRGLTDEEGSASESD